MNLGRSKGGGSLSRIKKRGDIPCGLFFVDGENDFSRTEKDLEEGGDKEVILASSSSSFLCGYGFGIFPPLLSGKL